MGTTGFVPKKNHMTSYIQPSSRLLVLLFRIKDLSLPLFNLMLWSINIMQCWHCWGYFYILKEIEANMMFSIGFFVCLNLRLFLKWLCSDAFFETLFWKKTDLNKQKRKLRLVIIVNSGRKINLLLTRSRFAYCGLSYWHKVKSRIFGYRFKGRNGLIFSTCLHLE